MQLQKILNNFTAKAKALYKDSIVSIMLFGSYARRDNTPDSDIDIFIIVKLSDSDIKKLNNAIYDIAYDIGLEYDVDIEPIVVNDKHFAKWKNIHPFYQNICQDGVTIYDQAS